MPLYLEILDQATSAAEPTLPAGGGGSILGAWTSETTGETVRLVDSPDKHASPRAARRSVRILFN